MSYLHKPVLGAAMVAASVAALAQAPPAAPARPAPPALWSVTADLASPESAFYDAAAG